MPDPQPSMEHPGTPRGYLEDQLSDVRDDVERLRGLLRDASTVMDGAVQHGYRPPMTPYAEDWSGVHARIDAELDRRPR